MFDMQLPIALVKAWVFIEVSEREDLTDAKAHVHQLIKEQFGSVDIALRYIDEGLNNFKNS